MPFINEVEKEIAGTINRIIDPCINQNKDLNKELLGTLQSFFGSEEKINPPTHLVKMHSLLDNYFKNGFNLFKDQVVSHPALPEKAIFVPEQKFSEEDVIKNAQIEFSKICLEKLKNKINSIQNDKKIIEDKKVKMDIIHTIEQSQNLKIFKLKYPEAPKPTIDINTYLKNLKS